MIASNEKTVGEIVAHDYRTAAIFESFGIDFCCKGGMTLERACALRKVDASEVKSKLDTLSSQTENGMPDFKSWPADLLADYIEKKHHRYIAETTPVLMQFLEKLCRVHGGRHPELHQIAALFGESAGELAMHMKKEELILFPHARNLVSGKMPANVPFGSAEQPVAMMMREHETEGGRFEQIAELTDNYTAPADGCTTYRVAFQMLKEFNNDLHFHIHLENNILFPAIIAMEKNRKQHETA